MWRYPETLTLGHFCFTIKKRLGLQFKGLVLISEVLRQQAILVGDHPPAHMTGTYDSAFQHKRVKGVDHVT